jgi:hypothetical protein
MLPASISRPTTLFFFPAVSMPSDLADGAATMTHSKIGPEAVFLE